MLSLKTTYLIFLGHSKIRDFIPCRRRVNWVAYPVRMLTVAHFLLNQAGRPKTRTSSRSSQLMKFIISCKRPLPRSALSGSRPSRWPPGLGSEDTPAGYHPPEGSPQISSVQNLSPFGDKSTRKGPGVGNCHLQRF